MKAVLIIFIVFFASSLEAEQYDIQPSKLGFSNAFLSISLDDSVRFVSADNHQHKLVTRKKLGIQELGYLNPEGEMVLKFDEPGIVEINCKNHDHKPMTVFVKPNTTSAVF